MNIIAQSKTQRRGFTLVEMLVVITIIVILAGLTMAGFNYANQKQAREQAKIQISLLKMALEDYKADFGEYPVHAEQGGENGTPVIYDALYPDGDDPNADANVYLSELNPENDAQNWLENQSPGSGLTIYDPWGTEFFYRTNDPADPNSTISANPGFDLWSAGPDGVTNPGANGDYDADHADNQDDIRGW